MPSVDVRVRLFMDMGYNPGFTGMARMRTQMRQWLSWPGSGNLILPDDPEIEYLDVLLVGPPTGPTSSRPASASSPSPCSIP